MYLSTANKIYTLMKKLLYLLLLLLCIGCSKDESPREGDIIFQTNTTQECLFIRDISNSEITHCGIIIEKEDGSFHVLHMLDRMMLTPLSTFVSQGFQDKYHIARVSNKKVDIDYAKYMNIPKDYFYIWNENELYNAELVYTIYKNELGIELCTPRPITDYNMEKLKSRIINRNIHSNNIIVTPIDIYNSPLLKSVRNRYDNKE